MKIFFSMSVAALLGFATVGTTANAQQDADRLWDVPQLATQHQQGPASVVNSNPTAPCPPGAPCAATNAAQSHAAVPPTYAPAPVQSSVPYYYGGGAVSSPVLPAQSGGCATGSCATSPYQSAMTGSWSNGGLRSMFSGKSCGNKLGGMFSRNGSCGTSAGLFSGSGSRGYSLFGRNSSRANNCGQPQWFGGAAGLVFFRDNANERFLSFPNGDPRNQVLTTRSVDGDTLGGVEVSVGRNLKNGMAIVGTYWGLFGAQDEAIYNGDPETYLAGLYNLNYNASTVGNYFDNVHTSHRVRMQNEFHNAELNLLRRFCASPLNGCGGRAVRIDMLAGPRYFNFDESFQYAGAVDPNNYGGDPNDLYYDIDVDNHLYGFQIGSAANYCMTQKLGFRVGTKAGVYANHVEHRQRIYGPLGNATINSGSYTGQDYDINSSKDDVAFLGELDLGLQYAVTQSLGLNVGYRGVFVNGVAHTTDQIPATYTSVPGIQQINSNGSLILHGIYAGMTFNY